MRFIIMGISIILTSVFVYVFFVLPKDDVIVSPTASVQKVVQDGAQEVVANVPLLPDLGPAPELSGLTNWINSDEIESLESLKGKVVLIDFWTLGCINCIRTLPHVTELYKKHAKDGFVILGIHAPEFAYERKRENVEAAVAKHDITYPVAQDNDFSTWKNYNNRYWPAHYLIDRQGRIRYTHFGEGKYQEMTENVQALLVE